LGKKIDSSVITSCVAIELIHTASLIHDDIIDHARSRRGVQTISAKEGVNDAILVGDYLFGLAAVQAASISKEVAGELAEAMVGLCDGQSRELADSYNTERSINSYLETIHGKTAMLSRAACRIGGLCGSGTETQIDSLGRFGEAFGMSFQLIDDLLDLLSSDKDMGKPVGNDIKEGVYTLPLLISLSGSSASKVRSYLTSNRAAPTKNAEIVSILMSDGSISETVKRIKHYNNTATKALADFSANAVVGGLSSLPVVYLKWALSKSSVTLPNITI